MATLTHPTSIYPRSFAFTCRTQASSFISPFGGQQQTVKNGGQWFEIEVQYPPLFQPDAETLVGFLNGLNGMVNDFTMTIPSRMRMASSSMTIVVNADGNTFASGSGQIGRFAVATTQGNRLIQFTGTGSLFPALPAGSHTLSNSAGAKFRLTTNDVTFNIDETQIYGVSVNLRDSI